MSKQRKKNSSFTQNDMSVLRRAQNENKLVIFERSHPVIKDIPVVFQRRYQAKHDAPQVGGESYTIKPGSLLSPVEDVLMMVDVLELLASHYSEELSMIEHRREDCTHLLEPEHDAEGMKLPGASDATVLAIGKKLQRISVERRNIKNRFEMIKAMKQAFATLPGQEALAFMRGLLDEAATIIAVQNSRTYKLKTDELDDIPQSVGASTIPAQ